MDDQDLSIDQAIAAQRALRTALGLPDERFPLPAFIGMISDEIEQMRQAGRTDQELLDIIRNATGQALSPADLERYYAPPETRRRGG